MNFYIRLITLAIIIPAVFTCRICLAQSQGVLLADDQGHTIYAQNEHRYFIPASTLKILTSLAAINQLGKDFCFTTWAYYDESTKDLFLKGFGAPLLISEQIQRLSTLIARQVTNGQKESGTVNNIIVDQTYFDPQITIPGAGASTNPYDATNQALCANFNTIFLKWDNTLKKYISAEDQTPLPEIVERQIKPGIVKSDRILLSYELRRCYAGILIQHFLKDSGVNITGTVQEGIFPDSAVNRIEFKSVFCLTEIIKRLLQFSNNFMANQLMLTMGAKNCCPPATLDKGVGVLLRFARTQLGLTDFTIVEGSGLSRKNQLTPTQMQTVLLSFMPFHHLMRKDGNEFYKTGTLSDVRTRAGYIKGQDNRLYPFVIMLNQTTKGNSYEPIRQLLHKKVAKAAALNSSTKAQ